MSKLTFWGRFLSDNSGAVGLPFEKNGLGDFDGVDQHDKNVLVVRGLFVCSPFCFGRASSLQSPRKITLCQRVTESPIMSDCL